MKRTVLAILLVTGVGAIGLGGTGTVPQAGRQTAPPLSADDRRAAFLTEIRRPETPLNPLVRDLPPGADLVQQHIVFAADALERVPVLLMKRPAGPLKRPVVIVLHGTGGRKEDQAPRLRTLAARGFIAISIDARYHGERTRTAPGPYGQYENAMLATFRTGRERPFLYDTVWDVKRLIDYLETRDDVDAARIGLTGVSKGGMETYLAAAVEPRVAVAVPFIAVQSFGWALDHGAWDSRAWTFRQALEAAASESKTSINAAFVRRFYDRVAPGIYSDFDGPAMLPLIAPKPLLVINGDSDPRTPMAGVRDATTAAQRAYEALGVPDNFRLQLQPNAGHEVTPAAYDAMVEWFTKWLEP